VGVGGDYLGMTLRVDALDQENLAYFRHCAVHDFHLQRCTFCGLLRYPPTTGCPWCGDPEAAWTPVEGRGPSTPIPRSITRSSRRLPSTCRT
jgi:hypothetical protein